MLTRLVKFFIAAVLMLALCCGLAGCASEPSEKTFKEAYEDKIDILTDKIGNYYDTVDDYDLQNMSVNVDLNVELSDDLLSFLRSYTSYDCEWINNTKINLSENIKDEKMSLEVGATYGKTEVVAAEIIMDLMNGRLFMGIPALSEVFLSQEDIYGYDSNPFDVLENLDVAAVLPDEELLKKVIKDIYSTLIENVEDVYTEEDTLAVNGVEQDCVTYEVQLSEKDVIKIAIKMLEMLESNSDFKKMFLELVKSVNEMAKEMGVDDIGYSPIEAYNVFTDRLSYAVYDLQDALDYATNRTVLNWTSYITKKLDLIGIKLEFKDEYEDFTFYAAKAQSNKDVGVKINFEQGDYTLMDITGELTDNGKKRSGSYQIKLDGQSIAFVDIENVDVKSLDKGYFVGALSISPSKGLRELILGGADFDFSMAGLSLSSLALRFDIMKNNGKELEMKLALMSGSEAYASVNIASTLADGAKIKLPKTTTDDAEDWLEEFDFDAFVKTAKKSGLPDYVVEILADIEYSFR